jgi:hypothetical protein
MTAVTVKDLAPGTACIAGQQLTQATGRPVQVVLIAIDLCAERDDVAVGAFNLPREALILVLEGALGAIRTGNCTTQVQVNGEVLAEYEGKPS